MAVINAQVSELIRSLRKKGWKTSAIAKHLQTSGIQPSLGTIRRHCRGSPVKKQIRKPRKLTSQVLEIIDTILKQDDKLPARKVRALLQRRHNITIGLCTMRKALRELGWNFGKPRFTPTTRKKKEELESLLAERSSQLAERSAQLTQKTIQLAAASERVAERDAEIVRLKEENEKLKQDIEGLRTTSHLDNHRGGLDILQEVRAGIGEIQVTLREQSRDFTPERPMPRCTSTLVRESSALQMSPLSLSATFNNSMQVPSQHADVTLRDVTPEDLARIHNQSYGQVGRYGILLFRSIISEDHYMAWSKTTNWDGARGKRALPQNVRSFVVSTLQQKFPDMGKSDLKDCIDKINEFLRTTRKSSQRLSM